MPHQPGPPTRARPALLSRIEQLLQPVLEAGLEVSIVGSYSRLGYELRRHLEHFTEVGEAGALAGKVAVITGGSSGIGLATACRLAELGADVVIAGRDESRNAVALQSISEAAGQGGARLSSVACDLSTLEGCHVLSQHVTALYSEVDILVNNAGALFARYTETTEAREATFALHVLAPFALTALLLPALRAAADHRGSARVITVSSGGMYTVGLDVAEITGRGAAGYSGTRAYAQAKRAQVALAAEWARRLFFAGPPSSLITSVAMHPGWVATPGLDRGLPRFAALGRPLLREPRQGADTIVFLACDGGVAAFSGGFFHDRRARPTTPLPWTKRPTSESVRLFQLCITETGIDPELPPAPEL